MRNPQLKQLPAFFVYADTNGIPEKFFVSGT